MSFQSDLSQEELKKLGFKPPAPLKPALASSNGMTNTAGFFNSNPWPLHIAISDLNMSIHLSQRGEYVVDADGKKVNDPILEQYVGPNMLSREISKVPVPVLAIKPVSTIGPEHSIHECKMVRQNGVVRPIQMEPPRDNIPVPASANPVVGMTMEQARALKLVKPVYIPEESAVEDTAGMPASGEKLPTLAECTARDMLPGEIRRIEKAKPATKAVIPPVAVAEDERQAQFHQTLLDSSQETADALEDAVSAAMNVGKAPQAQQAPQSIDENLPAPKLDGPKDRFVCSECGEPFDYRSQLKRHATQKHFALLSQILSKYPA